MIKSIFFFFFLLFRATPTPYGSSQARGWIRATAASLDHSHSNTGSKPLLQPTPQFTQCWIPNSLSEASDQTHVLMYTGWICFCCTTTGTPTINSLTIRGFVTVSFNMIFTSSILYSLYFKYILWFYNTGGIQGIFIES